MSSKIRLVDDTMLRITRLLANVDGMESSMPDSGPISQRERGKETEKEKEINIKNTQQYKNKKRHIIGNTKKQHSAPRRKASANLSNPT